VNELARKIVVTVYVTHDGMGESDNCTEDMSNPNYGEVWLSEIAEEELEGVCHGQGKGDGAGFEPHSDPFAGEDEEGYDQSIFLAGDGEAMFYPTRDTVFICIGNGDGWGNESGGGRVSGSWAAR